VPEKEKPVAERKAVAFTRNRAAFTRALRNAIFDLVKALGHDQADAVLGQIESADSAGTAWTRDRVFDLLDAYHEDHERIRLDPEARGIQHTHLNTDEPRRWTVHQTLVDPEELNDWTLRLTVDLDRSDAEARPVLTLEAIEPVA
jgi:hypothetical protein